MMEVPQRGQSNLFLQQDAFYQASQCNGKHLLNTEATGDKKYVHQDFIAGKEKKWKVLVIIFIPWSLFETHKNSPSFFLVKVL